MYYRLVSKCKARHFFLFPYRLFSTSTNALQLQLTSHFYGYENNKKIDFEALFKSCTKINHLKCLHAFLLVSGKAQNNFTSTRLVNLYARLGDISLSHSTFDSIQDKDVRTWNSIMSACVRNGRLCEAIDYFYAFRLTSGLKPDFYTFPPLLKACRNITDGKRLHCLVFKLGFGADVFVAASLVHMYTRFGFLDVARKLFDEMPFRDRGSWNAMISGYSQNGNAYEALDVLSRMESQGVKMDPVTICSILPVCAQSDDLLNGMLIHLYVIKHGLEFDLFVSNALINMYAKFGDLASAKRIFDKMVVRDVVSWNSIIAAYEQNSDPVTAFEYFIKMRLAGVSPDLLTLVSLASTSAQISDTKACKSIHSFAMRRYWLLEDVVIGNAVVDMYAKMGSVDVAHKVFEMLPFRDVISWNTLITGYAQNGFASEAIEAFKRMEQCEEITPNEGTWVGILSAYASVGAARQGMKVHGLVIKNSLCMDVYVATCLIDMYGKCGRLDDAISLFYCIPRDTSVTWNAVIYCYGIHGHGDTALYLFNRMLEEGVKPDHITLVSLLSACSHAGMVDEGQRYFERMQKEYGLRPALKHYGCMVDMLARAGYLEKAYHFIENMPVPPDASIWGALLGACRIHGNVELGAFALKRLFEVDSENVGYYVLLSNMYANVGKWEGVNDIRSLARDRGLKKTPGWSSIEINNKVDVFYMNNQSHSSSEEIQKELRTLTAKMKSLGYVPDYSFVLQDVEDDEKESILTGHSERLAIAYGIISSPPKTPIRIFKNLRVCGDCHNATKFISLITEREIIVRDANRFHNFKGGVCSCGDYW